ncbi:MAG: AAA family ATPase [Alphaproteobacteria bacterium]
MDGYLAKYLGDGVLAYFGYPQAHEDDASRGVHAGLGTVNGMNALNQTLAERYLETLEVRVGIHTGLVVAGEMGAGETRESLAIVGETPNVAARLEGLAEPGGIVIGPVTESLVQGQFDCQPLGQKSVKGISKPIDVFAVKAVSKAASRFEASRGKVVRKLVGRDREVERLMGFWHQAVDGHGVFTVVSGEAGVGKSHLVDVVRDGAQRQGGSIVTFQCSPHYGDSPLYPVIGCLERMAGLEASDPAREKRRKLDHLTERLAGTEPHAAPLFAALLSLPPDQCSDLPAMSPPLRKQRTLTALAALFIECCRSSPSLLLVEDAHWMDATTLAMMELLAGELEDLRLLVVVTTRPVWSLPVAGFAHAVTIPLRRLGQDDVLQLMEQVSDGRTFPNEVVKVVMSRSDGVPMFVEELTKAMLESDALVQHDDHFRLKGVIDDLIPATLADLLTSRLDALGEGKDVAQIGSVIGARFEEGLLRHLSEMEQASIALALARLVDADILAEENSAPMPLLRFHHALLRDAAYGSILKRRRKDLHGRIAALIEDKHPEISEKEPETLARHHEAAGNVLVASEYWLKAGRRAVGSGANVETIGHFKRGLRQLALLPADEDRNRKELTFLVTMGPAVLATAGWASAEARDVYQRAGVLSGEIGDVEQSFMALWGTWLFHTAAGEIAKARSLLDQLFELSTRHDDASLRMQAHHAAWGTICWLGEFDTALDHVERGLAIYDPEKHRGDAMKFGGHDPLVCGKVQGGLSRLFKGFPDQARRDAEDGLGLARDLAHPQSIAHALLFGCMLFHHAGDNQTASQWAESLKSLAEDHAMDLALAQVAIFRGWGRAQHGDLDDGLGELRHGLARFKAVGMGLSVEPVKALLAQLLIKTGEFDEAEAELLEAFELAEAKGVHLWKPELHRVMASLVRSRSPNSIDHATKELETSIEIARGQGNRVFELKACMSLAELLADQGHRSEAIAQLSPVVNSFTEGFDMPWLMQAGCLLERINAEAS